MKILSQKKEDNKVFLEIEEEYSSFKQALDKTLLEAGKEIKIPGFRPGKAPREIIEKNINPQALENEAAQKLISELYPQIVEKTKINPVDYPRVEVVQQKSDRPFVFKLEVEVYPEVKLGKYKGLKANKPTAAVKEEEILEALGNLQKRFKKGEEEIPLDNEFAKKVSGFGTLAELKEEIREALLKRKNAEAEEELKNQLIAEVARETKVDIPAAMVEREIEIMLNELKTSLAQSRLTIEDYLKGIKKEEKTLRDELSKSAEVRVKGKIVLHAVAEKEAIKVTEQEAEEEIQKLAETTGESIEEFKKGLGRGGKDYVEDYLLRRKALDFLVDNAKIKEEALT